jgi:hypothetical protein
METVKRFLKGLSWTQVISAAAAAATALLLSTQIGVAGSVLGAAVSSIISTFATTIYKNTLTEGARAVKRSRGLPTEDLTEAARSTSAGSQATQDSRTAQATEVLTNTSRTGTSALSSRKGRLEDDVSFDDGSAQALASLDDPNTVSFPAVSAAQAGLNMNRSENPLGAERKSGADAYDKTQTWPSAATVTAANSTYGYGYASPGYASQGYAPQSFRQASYSDASASTDEGQQYNTRKARRSKAWKSLTTLVIGLAVAAVALFGCVWAIDKATSGNGLGIKTAIIQGTEEISEKLASLFGTQTSDQSTSSADTTSDTSTENAGSDLAAPEATIQSAEQTTTVTSGSTETTASPESTTTTVGAGVASSASSEQAQATDQTSDQTTTQTETSSPASDATGTTTTTTASTEGTGTDAGTGTTGTDANATGNSGTAISAA